MSGRKKKRKACTAKIGVPMPPPSMPWEPPWEVSALAGIGWLIPKYPVPLALGVATVAWLLVHFPFGSFDNGVGGYCDKRTRETGNGHSDGNEGFREMGRPPHSCG